VEKLFIDIIGAAIGVFATLLFYETFWTRKTVKQHFFIGGILINVALGVGFTAILQNVYILPILIVLLHFMLSFYYKSNLVQKVLLSVLITAIAFASEMSIGFLMIYILDTTVEHIQTSMLAYMFGVLTSSLFVLFVVLMLRVFIDGKEQDADKKFNFLLAFMPVQSMVLSYMVSSYSIRTDARDTYQVGLIAIFLSILLILVTISILNRQRKALAYKREYELERTRLKMQIEHYQELYQEQQRIKALRHEMKNSMISIVGMLEAGQIDGALDKVRAISENTKIISNIVDTGNPPIDAILNAKIVKAKKSGIKVDYTVLLDKELYIDQFDIASILANAMDNAIEGVSRAIDINKIIALSVNREGEYISILIENNTSGLVYDDFETTKLNKKDHGYGMTQMKDVTQKYNGSFQPMHDSETGKFLLQIMLKNEKIYEN